MSTTTDSISVQAAKEHPLPEYAPGQVLGGKYEVLSKLGEGLLGTIYKVKVREGGAIRALKLLRPKLVAAGVDIDSFRHHLQAAKKLVHPGIVAVHDAGQHEGTLFFTMDYVEGKTVRDLIDESRQKGEDVSDRDMREVLVGVLDVLVHAHKVTLHRDLKPENIFLVANGQGGYSVKVSDFSIAQLISPTIFADSTLNRLGAFYMAPEMSEFRDKTEANADLYSLGAIFYELLVGRPPTGSYELPAQIRPDISSKVDDIIEISLAPNAQDRFQTAADMLAAVNQAFSDLHGGGGANIKRTMALLAALVVVTGLAAVYFRSQKETPEQIHAAKIIHRDLVRAAVKAKAGTAAAAPAPGPNHADMIYVAAGPYVAGAYLGLEGLGLAGERTEAEVDVPGYWIDVKETHFPHADAADGETPEQTAEREARNKYAYEPVRDVTWSEAKGACETAGKRLCSEDEWEKACKGPEQFEFVYGDEFDGLKCPRSGYLPPPYRVNQFPLCMSGYGVWGLGGGLMEWTSTRQGPLNYVVKGGAIGNESKGTRCAGRADRAANFAQTHIGFRCCAD